MVECSAKNRISASVLAIGTLVVSIVASSFARGDSTGDHKKHPLIVPPNPVRFGDRSLHNTIRTDERYGHDGLFQGPRGWSYWNYLENPKPIQNPNLWPDMKSTYFIGRFAMPAGSSMTLRGTFPYARFFQFALYKFERNTFVAFGQSLRGPDIEPDSGSTNPFRVGANRLSKKRNFTIHVLAEDPPKAPTRRARNTLYVGREGNDIEGVIRIYLPDQDRDGTGWGPLNSSFGGKGFPVYEGKLADGTKLSTEQFAERFAKPFVGETTKPMTADQWVRLVNARDNDPKLSPQTAPARNPPRWEKFTTIRYGVAGAFKSPTDRAKIPFGGPVEGGGEGPYLVTYLSRQYGPVYVMRGKMPTFPDTYAGKNGRGAATMSAAQTQYWSLVSCESVASGQVVDGLTDFQIPLDKNRNYTIVVSRPEDRPKNATLENGVAWVKWSPRGEGIGDQRNRADFGMLLLRIMGNHPDWKQRPDNITKPGSEEAVMGPYFPKGYYTTTKQFEANGGNAQSGQVVMTTGQGRKMKLTMQTLKKSRGYQYCELVFNYGAKGNDIYSTSPLARADLRWWNNLDLKALAKEFGAKSVYKNGPQWWSMDEVGVMASKPVNVAGVKMVFGAHLPPNTLSVPKYKVFSPAKFQNLYWKKGKPVYQLVDPDGHVYVLQGHKVPVDQLATLGKKFRKLPRGWKYRVKVYDKDLVMLLTPKVPIPSVQDEFDQIYIRVPEKRAGAAKNKNARKVTVDNFIRAETDKYFKTYVAQGAFGQFFHLRRPTPIDEQGVIRMNRDTLYSLGVFDLAAGPVTIHKPDTGKRFQSIQVINQDHYTQMVIYEPGTYSLTRNRIGTRYVGVTIRTFVDANDPDDVKKANAIQNQTTAKLVARGTFKVPQWDETSHDKLRSVLNGVASTLDSTKGMFGAKGAVDPVKHLLGTAYGWGGNPLKDATYLNVVPEKNDGKTPHTLTVKDVPVDGFWSITVYNKDGFMQKNGQNTYAFNNVTAKRNSDGSITINFGRGRDAVNNIPITSGWNYIVRLYRPRNEILDGRWKFPQATPVN